MNLIDLILNPLENCEYTFFKVCKLYNLPISREVLREEVLEHPDYPSLLTLSDAAQSLGLQNQSARVKDIKKLIELNSPFVTQVKIGNQLDALFSLVYEINEKDVIWDNPLSNKKETIQLSEFSEYYLGYVQVYEKEENNSHQTQPILKRKFPFEILLIIILPLFVFGEIAFTFFDKGLSATYPSLFILTLMIGVVFSGLLVVYEINEYNPILNKMCNSGENRSCSSVLNSKGASIFGLKWSVLGFSYFLGFIIILLFHGIKNQSLLSMLAFLNLLALPYVLYSIYYQKYIVKQWCVMCLSVQAVLIVLFLISYFGGFFKFNLIDFGQLTPLILALTIIFIITNSILYLVKSNKDGISAKRELRRFKSNPAVFNTLLNISEEVILDPDLGITIGNPLGNIHLAMVSNPYCKPCALAHQTINQLLENNRDVRFQIIYSVGPEKSDWRNMPVKNILALGESSDIENLPQALNDWYQNMNYKAFSKEFAFNDLMLEAQLKKISKMKAWVNSVHIEATPTFFIANKRVPRAYKAEDLKYLLSV